MGNDMKLKDQLKMAQKLGYRFAGIDVGSNRIRIQIGETDGIHVTMRLTKGTHRTTVQRHLNNGWKAYHDYCLVQQVEAIQRRANAARRKLHIIPGGSGSCI